MTLVVWNDTYLLGHKMLDTQHRTLLALLMKLDIAFKSHMPREITLNIGSEIRKYADFHFQSEETLMRVLEYPELERHASSHARLLQQLDGMLKDAEQGRESPINLTYMLGQWIVGHLVSEDQQIAEFLKRSSHRLIAEEEFALYSK